MTTYYVISWVMKILHFYSYLLIARILMSWVPDIERTKVGQILVRVTEPYLGIFRRFIPSLPLGGGYLDFSPIVALLAWSFVENGVAKLLVMLFIQG